MKGDQLCIIDCLERPMGENVALVNFETRTWQYISDAKVGRDRKKRPIHPRDEPTTLAEFGVEAVVVRVGRKTAYRDPLEVVLFVPVGESVATYRSGRPRQWQESLSRPVCVRQEVAKRVFKLCRDQRDEGAGL